MMVRPSKLFSLNSLSAGSLGDYRRRGDWTPDRDVWVRLQPRSKGREGEDPGNEVGLGLSSVGGVCAVQGTLHF